MALGTKWGLFRHYWILFKLVLTVLAATVLLLNMQTVSFLASEAANTGIANLGGLRSELIHAGGGLLVLLIIMILSVYKPQGMTSYGWHKQNK
ncbi:hypothetical protein [Alkalihalobacillus sp. AL-G]|uniref:hypothetical protein n=1 Tax=Alkalihalobacillus sp. AL-G TaxID=2926399 RepID=UPI00272C567D|nr:hypothetical protein [Alkalihalobacillus sp. AL-G]WLD92031.1 hypothetical protein MOJ78_13435 [Alkalihalobacillus sp. AL-G]